VCVCAFGKKIVGKHNGSVYYTVGQGAKISGANHKWFICKKELADGTVFVCNSTHHPSLYSNELYVRIKDFSWINEIPPPPLLKRSNNNGQSSSSSFINAHCRTRHLQPLIPCQVSLDDDSNHLIVKFDRPVRAITPGQQAAIYVGKSGLICLGGGPIWMHGPTYHEVGLDLPSQLHPAGNNDRSVLNRVSQELSS
jgi:tRNA-specific 2-thiouridylase